MAIHRCLIVANQTLGGKALARVVEHCINRDIRTFFVVVPMTRVEHETTEWQGGFRLGDSRWAVEVPEWTVEEEARWHESVRAESRQRAQQRLDLMIDEIRAAGGDASGEVGPEDPFEAASAVLSKQPRFEHVIISTLPAGISQWLGRDLPNRIARITDAPVTTIEADTPVQHVDRKLSRAIDGPDQRGESIIELRRKMIGETRGEFP